MASIFYKQLSPRNVPLPAVLLEHPLGELLSSVLHKAHRQRRHEAAELLPRLHATQVSNIVGVISGVDTCQHLRPNSRPTSHPNDALRYTKQTSANLFSGVSERKKITVLAVSMGVRISIEEQFDQDVVEAIYRDQKAQVIETGLVLRWVSCRQFRRHDHALFWLSACHRQRRPFMPAPRLEIIGSQTHRNHALNAQHGFYLEVRQGIHTGMVTLFGDNVPEGETPNLALSLSRYCADGQILCSMSVQRLLSTYIEIEPMNGLDVGYPLHPMPAYVVLGERSIEAFGSLRGKGRPLVGG